MKHVAGTLKHTLHTSLIMLVRFRDIEAVWSSFIMPIVTSL